MPATIYRELTEDLTIHTLFHLTLEILLQNRYKNALTWKQSPHGMEAHLGSFRW